jgi:hypothetical protein
MKEGEVVGRGYLLVTSMPLRERLPGDMVDVVEFGEVDEVGEGAKFGFAVGEVLDMIPCICCSIGTRDS